MHNLPVALIIPAFIVFLVGFACLIIKIVSLFGWYWLAKQFKIAEQEPTGTALRVQHVRIGLASYNGVIKAATSAVGLSLSVAFIFRVGHPPLLIPWSCIGPLEERRFLWSTTYTTRILTDSGSIRFKFSSRELKNMIQPWLPEA